MADESTSLETTEKTPEQLAAEAAAAGAAEAKTPEQLQEEERLAAEAAAQAAEKEKPVEITDEVLFAQIEKVSNGKIKTRADLDTVLSFNADEHIKPASDLIRKLNDWKGDPKEFIELSSLDLEKLSPKEAIVRSMMVNGGKTREDAELLVEHKYGDAFKTEEDDGFNLKLKRIAELQLEDDSKIAKGDLSKYQVEKLQQGQTQPTQEEIAAIRKRNEETWDKPVATALDSLKGIESTVTFKLPDEQEVTENFVFGADKDETKAIVKDMLSGLLEPDGPQQFAQKFFNIFGKGNTPEEGFKNLTSAIYSLLHQKEMLANAYSLGASKGLAAHLEKVAPGNLDPTKQSAPAATDNTVTPEQAFVKALNDRMMKKTPAQ